VNRCPTLGTYCNKIIIFNSINYILYFLSEEGIRVGEGIIPFWKKTDVKNVSACPFPITAGLQNITVNRKQLII
jgi:hypothetical protein